MSRKGSDQGPLCIEFFINISCYYCCSWENRGCVQHQALGHVLRAQGLLSAPSAPISVPLPSHAETGCLGAKAKPFRLIPRAEDLSSLLTSAGGEAHMKAAQGVGGCLPLTQLPTCQKLSAANSWGNDAFHCRRETVRSAVLTL